MKFNFDIECTPEEARAFIGLPNIAPMQERMIQTLEERMKENLQTLSPDEIIKTWMPATMQGFSDIQKTFWGQMGVKMPQAPQSSPKDKT